MLTLLGLIVLGAVTARVAGGKEASVLWSAVLFGASDRDFSRLAALRQGEGKFEDAVVLYRAAAALDLRSSFYPANQAILLAHLGRLDEAEQALRDAEEAFRRYARNEGDTMRQLLDAARATIAWHRR